MTVKFNFLIHASIVHQYKFICNMNVKDKYFIINKCNMLHTIYLMYKLTYTYDSITLDLNVSKNNILYLSQYLIIIKKLKNYGSGVIAQ